MFAEKMRQRRKDIEHWEMGMYALSAVSVAIMRSINGKKAQYLKEPMHERDKEIKEEDLTEEQKEIGRRNLLMSLQIMQTNFEMNHSDHDRGG